MSERAGTPGALSRVLVVARWSFFELLWSPRTLAMAAIALGPVGLAILYRVAAAFSMTRGSNGYDAFASIVAGASFPFVAPMLALFYASGVVSDDVEAGTMRYFLTRPVGRPALLAGKMAASFVVEAVLLLPSLVVAFYALVAPSGLEEVGARFPTLLRDLWVAVLGLAAYNGVFALAGTALRRPLLAGLFFIFGWQSVATFVPGKARLLTISHYLRSLVPHPSSGGLAFLGGVRSSTLTCLAALFLAILLTHGLAIWIFSRREIRP